MADGTFVFLKGIAPGTSQQAIVPDQGGLLAVRIDPTWGYYKQWKARANIGAFLNITFCDLDGGIEENAAVNYQETQVLGRAEQFKTFVGVSNRQVHFTFQFRAQGLRSTSYLDAIDKEVTQPTRWLESLKFPFIDDQGISHSPPPLILTVGQLLMMRCLATEVTPRWLPPWDPATGLSQSADVSCCFEAVHETLGNYNYYGPGRFDTFQSTLLQGPGP